MLFLNNYLSYFQRCLHKTGGSLQFTAKKCVSIIECCMRLHNKAITEGLPLQDANEPITILHNDEVYQGNVNHDGYAARETVTQRF